MSKKDLNAWDRFWAIIKANEKVMWVVLLVLICPFFAFPVSMDFFARSGRQNDTVAMVFGQSISQNDYTETLNGIEVVRALRRFSPFEPDFSGVIDLRLHAIEADRLGIGVGDAELGAEIREVYWRLAAEEAMYNALRNVQDPKAKDFSIQQQVAFQTYQTRYDELKKNNRFGDAEQREWGKKLRERNINGRFFEKSLRDMLRAEKLEKYWRDSVQVAPEEVMEEFKAKEQTRKLSFFEVGSAETRAEIEKSVTDEELKRRYDADRDEFREPLKIRTDYLSLPVKSFEKDVSITDQDIQEQYDKVKTQRYQTLVGGGVEGSFDLLSPEEKAAREAKAFRPLAEVKEELKTELTKTKTIDAARTAAEKIRERLYPTKPSTIGDKDKKEEKPAPAPATFAELAKDYPVAKTGTTPFVSRQDYDSVLGAEIASGQFRTWFDQAEGTRTSPGKKDLEAPRAYSSAPNFQDLQYFIFYQSPKVRPAGVPKFEDAREKVKEAVVKEKLLAKAKEKAEALAGAIKEGKKTFEDAAKEAGQPIVTTGFLERFGAIKVPRTPEEMKKAEEEAKARASGGAPAPVEKEKVHPGSHPILEYVFKTLKEPGKVDGFAEDPANSVCYIARFDERTLPDPAKFAEKRATHQRQLLNEKQTAYLAKMRADLTTRGTPMRVGAEEAEEKKEGETKKTS